MAKRRVSLHVDGVTHRAPIPMGARVGNMVFSSGIMGTDPATGEVPDDPAAQARLAFANMKSLIEGAGGSLEDIGHVRVLIKDDSIREFVNAPWLEHFPDPENRPARHAVVQPLRGKMLVQLEMIAVLPGAGEG
jgi:2-iminobutanoate/2-iminopropanoate deaminase